MNKSSIKIAGASGYWGDYTRATEELLNTGGVDLLVYDYLAEIAMSIMARAREKDNTAGYAMDFVHQVLRTNLSRIARDRVRVIANAGSVNPLACAEAIRSLIDDAGLDLKVAVVLGDDSRGKVGSIKATEIVSGKAFPDADKKERVCADNCIKRAEFALLLTGLTPFIEISVEIPGAECQFGAFRQIDASREVMVKLAARHELSKGVAIFLWEITGMALSSPPGLCAFAGTRAKPSPVARLFSFLIEKTAVTIHIDLGDRELVYAPVAAAADKSTATGFPVYPLPFEHDIFTAVPLIVLAYGRSGDKGNNANIGIISRRPEFLPFIWLALMESVVAERFSHFVANKHCDPAVARFLLPGTHAINFLIHDVLGGGGAASLRNDPSGKGFAQILLAQSVPVSREVLQILEDNL